MARRAKSSGKSGGRGKRGAAAKKPAGRAKARSAGGEGSGVPTRQIAIAASVVGGLVVLGVGVGLIDGRASAALANAAVVDSVDTGPDADSEPVGGPEILIPWETDAAGTPILPAGERLRVLDAAQAALAGTEGDDDGTLSAAPLRRVHAALLATGWFDSIAAVRRDAAGDLVVAVDGADGWRRPYACVRSGGFDRVVTRDGRVLPLKYAAGEASGVLPVVVGVSALPLGDDEALPDAAGSRLAWGESWDMDEDGGRLRRGLALLGVLGRSAAVNAEVLGVDATFAGELRILTVHGTRIVWGGMETTVGPRPGEPTDQGKLRTLERTLERFGRIDAGVENLNVSTPGRAEVDLSGGGDDG